MLSSIWLAQQRQSFAIGLTSAMTGILLLTMLTLVVFILSNSSQYFWPSSISTLTYLDETGAEQQVFAKYSGDSKQAYWRSQQLNAQYLYIDVSPERTISAQLQAQTAEIVLRDGRSLYASIGRVQRDQMDFSRADLAQFRLQTESLSAQIQELRYEVLSPLHVKLADFDKRQVAPDAPARVAAEKRFKRYQLELEALLAELSAFQVELVYADDTSITIAISEIEQISLPNQMSIATKTLYAMNRFWLFVSDSPKQANSAGGVFPALFGTVLMVMLMSVMVTPLGVLTAIYLHEYAPQNLFTSLVRTCVNNLAGIPSIVFGVFGLGFLVYTLGGGIDRLFFGSELPNSTFGTPGIFWAALTMALLTLPVVIVSTEEGLRRVPKSLRQGSYALGATKAETIRYAVLPIASPGIMTGVILAIARAAGEVAPLILVGAVKFAPALPIDTQFPYLHLERQFMHLGVMIYDGAFHGQQHSQSADFMFAACFLLLLIVVTLNLIATLIRSKLRRRYAQ